MPLCSPPVRQFQQSSAAEARLKRDIRKATGDLQALAQRLERQAAGKARGKPLTISGVRSRADKLLERQYMANLFPLDIGGTDARPTPSFRFDDDAWERLEACRLGPTAVVTDRNDCTVERTVSSLREQSHVEFAFRQVKDPQRASAVTLRHYSDSPLRVHATLSELALLLAKLVVRCLKRAGVETTVGQALPQEFDATVTPDGRVPGTFKVPLRNSAAPTRLPFADLHCPARRVGAPDRRWATPNARVSPRPATSVLRTLCIALANLVVAASPRLCSKGRLRNCDRSLGCASGPIGFEEVGKFRCHKIRSTPSSPVMIAIGTIPRPLNWEKAGTCAWTDSVA